jgi:hypothetical protein
MRIVDALAVVGTAAALGLATGAASPWSAHADATAYLVNVTVRPGYNFANAENALTYGHGVCDKVAQGESYAQVIRDVKNDFGTSDEYQASYLITQAVGELCPAQIWQLRESAGGYRPTTE